MKRTWRFPWIVAPLVGAMSTACGGGAPVMQGRVGMIGEAGVANACEEAAKNHLEPFVVEWDATELASFEARAAMNTIFVKYEGCDVEVLYGCQKSNQRGAFGAYGRPLFTSGSLQSIDIKTENELYAKLPLSAVSLGGRVSGGESLRLRYFVSGLATNTRNEVARTEIANQPGCQGATHFVWAYNLGAFELDIDERTAAEAKVGFGDLGGGVSGSKERSSAGRGGDLKSCATQDQRACRTPIRLTLRPLAETAAAPVTRAEPGPVDGGTADQSAEMALEAAVAKREARDGGGCLQAIAQAIGYRPQSNTAPAVQVLRAECLMLDGQCADGKAAWREAMAARDVKREMSDVLLDLKTREQSNKLCPASSADNDADRVMRLTREIQEASKVGDTEQCTTRFAAFRPAYVRLRKQKRPAASSVEQRAEEFGSSAYTWASGCFAKAGQCEASKQAFLGQYEDAGTPGVSEATLVPIWERTLKATGVEACP